MTAAGYVIITTLWNDKKILIITTYEIYCVTGNASARVLYRRRSAAAATTKASDGISRKAAAVVATVVSGAAAAARWLSANYYRAAMAAPLHYYIIITIIITCVRVRTAFNSVDGFKHAAAVVIITATRRRGGVAPPLSDKCTGYLFAVGPRPAGPPISFHSDRYVHIIYILHYRTIPMYTHLCTV